MLDHKDQLDHKEQPVLEQPVPVDLQEQQDHKAHKDLLVPQEQVDLLEQQDHKVHKDHKVLLVQRVLVA